ncbi:MAG: Aliphatic nitrilase [Synergistetes bacterium ADurb.Bin155]|jgi:predicted amidohydrolase|nr:carbon-nitrogen hydrolase family protein [Synergistales bacterium]NMD17383.1 carbon-nitrogen hydrolase family protein [Synergistaceae bacterium]OQB45460.1 MAG: Aliphatic nitrilase [Synergistetes bacterium ADurb.Bin155]HOC82623.1 carbon-nitrogen hydrolase family protein [Synergistales bacterium]HQL02204.1 carbon-nitrogen hydrolase family protein [Synergistales bacterium]
MTEKVKEVNVAIIQEPPVFLNLGASVEKACTLTRKAAGNGARVVVFPETWLPGYPVWIDSAPEAALWGHDAAKGLFRRLVENALTLQGEETAALARAAVESKVHMVMGAHELVGNTLYNTMLFISPGGVYSAHRKLTPTYTERLLWGMGDGSTLVSVDAPFGVLGGLICWEHWLPLARAAMHARKETVHVAQWPWVRDLHLVASRHYAFEGQCFVLAAGTVLTVGDVLEGYDSLPGAMQECREMLSSMGNPEEPLQRGGSTVIAPDSICLVEPLYDAVGTVHATLDLGLVTEGHLLMDSDGHYSRPDVFTLTVNTAPLRGVRFEPRQ